jgi:protein-L-isoaspartate(D-aspartate) O-methyltransferase
MLKARQVVRLGTRSLLCIAAVLLAALPQVGRAADDLAARRAAMVQLIEEVGWGRDSVLGRDEIDPRVLEVMARVPRHEFVPPDLRDSAYANRPLPIGYGQTISQPLVVALMSDLLLLEADHAVLEVGTGSGYHAAVVAGLARRVHTIEIIPGLAETAAARLSRLGYDTIQVHFGDGYYGWEAGAPFDRILVTAAASHVPPPLIAQLKPGGRMVIPVGGAFTVQHLVLVEKDAEGGVRSRQVLPVRFVPLTRGD